MIKRIGIYILYFPNGKCYVGQSVDCDDRFRCYSKLNCKKQPKLYNALCKYGWDAVRVEFTPCIESMLDMCEKCTIAGLNSVLDGYNCDWGGKKNKRHSDETIAKISESHTGKSKHNDDSKRRIGEAARGRTGNIGRVFTDEHKRNISEAVSGNKSHRWKGGADRICPTCKINKVHIFSTGRVAGDCKECRNKAKRFYYINKKNKGVK